MRRSFLVQGVMTLVIVAGARRFFHVDSVTKALLHSAAMYRNRTLTLLALASTALVLLILNALAPTDADILAKYNLDATQLQTLYAVLLLALLPAVVFEPQLRAALQKNNMVRMLVLIVAGVVSFLLVWTIKPGQEGRLFQFPFSLWLVTAHGVGLCALAALLALDRAPSDFLVKAATGVLATFIGLLAVAHVASLGEFMRLDLPDEPWLASMATNYARNGDLSPSYIGSVYGTPDPVLPRYYWLMGLWLRLVGSETLAQLRTFPLLVGAVAAMIVAMALWRVPSLNRAQKLAGILTLLALSAFVRASHNLRMDIGLAVYGATVLFGLVMFFERKQQEKRWPLLVGAALYPGLETVPTVALPLGAAVGLTFILWTLRQPRTWKQWQYIAVYALACALAGLLFLAVHFLPNYPASIEGYRLFSSRYLGLTQTGVLRLPFDSLSNLHLRFSLSLSPLEAPLALLALLLAWRGTGRWVLLPFGVGLLALLVIVQFSYAYWAVFAPVVSYAAAKSVSGQRTLMVGAFVLVPALAAAPLHDMLNAAQTRLNERDLTEAAAVREQIPAGTTVVGEPLFWFVLQDDHRYIGWTGIGLYTGFFGSSLEESLLHYDPGVVICWSGYTERCQAVDDLALYRPPSEIQVSGETYYLFNPSSSK